ncbi:DeoR/GlpR family DNA-binding transcription regulator [Actinomadura oligospora]|uniref:DeoR/GlpR family DNA-binding transcription regulator n=1 Tax=Actinomadura oligospora TaxID=111804 RepID=UPI00047BA772|nr:DeoR/GlpR family DNA-binding transcription regulator [Actinomadura oligospora]
MTDGTQTRFAAERHERLLRLLRERGAMPLQALAEALTASEATVRRDLRTLEARGLLARSRGGAAPVAGLAHEPTQQDKSTVAVAEKAAIAEAAAALVGPDDAVVIGPGTTTRQLALRLAAVPGLTVITNSLAVAEALADSRTAQVVLTGGALRGPIRALVGAEAERFLGTVRVRYAFLSGNGLTAARGLSTPHMAVAAVDRAIAASAEHPVVLADHTKVGADAVFQTVPAERIAHLVTDAAADRAELAALAEAGVTVHRAEPS